MEGEGQGMMQYRPLQFHYNHGKVFPYLVERWQKAGEVNFVVWEAVS